jgi:hypothetical protein
MIVSLTGNHVFFRSNDADSSIPVYQHRGEFTNMYAVRVIYLADNHGPFRSSGADRNTLALQRRGEYIRIGGIRHISLTGHHIFFPVERR